MEGVGNRLLHHHMVPQVQQMLEDFVPVALVALPEQERDKQYVIQFDTSQVLLRRHTYSVASDQPCKAGLNAIGRKLGFKTSSGYIFSSGSIVPGLYVYKGHTEALDGQCSFGHSAPHYSGNLIQIGGGGGGYVNHLGTS